METSKQTSAAATAATSALHLASTSTNPLNQKYPEIITVTESNEKIEATEEHNLLYESGAPKGTMLVKKVSHINRTIRTTTPYTGTV